MPRSGFVNAKNFAREACGCEILLWRISQLQNGLLGCEMAHVCLGVVSQPRNFLQGDPLFAAKPQFRSMALLATKWFRREGLFSFSPCNPPIIGFFS